MKRLAANKELKLGQFIQIGLWWGAAIGFVASLAGLATVKWWSRPHTAVYPDLSPPSLQAIRWTWLFAVAATLVVPAPIIVPPVQLNLSVTLTEPVPPKKPLDIFAPAVVLSVALKLAVPPAMFVKPATS